MRHTSTRIAAPLIVIASFVLAASAAHALEAEDWYRDIRTACFAG